MFFTTHFLWTFGWQAINYPTLIGLWIRIFISLIMLSYYLTGMLNVDEDSMTIFIQELFLSCKFSFVLNQLVNPLIKIESKLSIFLKKLKHFTEKPFKWGRISSLLKYLHQMNIFELHCNPLQGQYRARTGFSLCSISTQGKFCFH